ncbi:MAG TPA: hypothetical protein VK416_00965 [Thermoanaerobaculia bacterium]|nr:hypothetical protein [Thermoanaerobaculia bacterium]
MAVALRWKVGITVKTTVALVPERWDGLSGAGLFGLFPRRYLMAALVGELLAAIALFASDNVSPVLVRSLQLFLRF